MIRRNRVGRLTGLFIFILWTQGIFAQSVGTAAPPFSGTTLEGKTISLSDFHGKVVLLDIWASWCGPCKQEMPFLVQMDKQYGEAGLVILTVNIDKDCKNAAKFISVLDPAPSFPVILDPDAKIPPLYKVAGMPTTLLIDRGGKVRYRHEGFKPEKKEDYVREIDSLLKEKPEP